MINDDGWGHQYVREAEDETEPTAAVHGEQSNAPRLITWSFCLAEC